jgi:hypothetical protein
MVKAHQAHCHDPGGKQPDANIRVAVLNPPKLIVQAQAKGY